MNVEPGLLLSIDNEQPIGTFDEINKTEGINKLDYTPLALITTFNEDITSGKTLYVIDSYEEYNNTEIASEEVEELIKTLSGAKLYKVNFIIPVTDDEEKSYDIYDGDTPQQYGDFENGVSEEFNAIYKEVK